VVTSPSTITRDVRISAVDMFVDSTLRYGREVQMTVTEDRKIRMEVRVPHTWKSVMLAIQRFYSKTVNEEILLVSTRSRVSWKLSCTVLK
jgi:hypothetical protein